MRPSEARPSTSRSRRKLARSRCFRHCNSPLKIPIPVLPIAVKATAAPTRIRCPGLPWILRPMKPVLRTKPLPMELDPQVVFERLFGSGATPEERTQRRKQRQSILDSVVSELASIKKESRRRATAEPSTISLLRFMKSNAVFSWRRRLRRQFHRSGNRRAFRTISTHISNCISI